MLVTVVCATVLVLLAGCGVEVITPGTATETPPLQPLTTPLPTHVATVTAPFQPPPATATPTATPIPIIHVIQEGDTLGGIAAAYGVSVEALQVANGIENPLLLQIGQELVIPTGEEVAVGGPGLLLPTPTPLPFGVRGMGFYETPVGSLWCLGEVVNTTAYSITNVLVQVTLFDSAGVAVTEGTADLAAADILPPSARAPFGVLFVSPPPDFTSHQVTILRGETAGELGAGYVPLVVEGAAGTPLGPQFEVSGTVRNGGPTQTVFNVMVIVTTYDGEGRVTGFRQRAVEVGGGLAPGGTASFSVLLTAHGDAPADFSIIAFGRTQGG